jgi:hypothetical protein
MVGRTPEYLGKKIESYEVKMASIVILVPPLIVLVGDGDRQRDAGSRERRSQSRRAWILGDPLRVLVRW